MEPLDDSKKVWGRLVNLRMRKLDEIEAEINHDKATVQTIKRLSAIAGDLLANRTWCGADRRKLVAFSCLVDRVYVLASKLAKNCDKDTTELKNAFEQLLGMIDLSHPDEADIQMAIRFFFSDLLSAGKPNQKGAQPPDSGNPTEGQKNEALSNLQPAHRLAYLAGLLAEQKAGRQLSDKKAWEWLNDCDKDLQVELFEHKLPSLKTFSRYRTEARRALNERRKQPRGGRAGGSVKRESEL